MVLVTCSISFFYDRKTHLIKTSERSCFKATQHRQKKPVENGKFNLISFHIFPSDFLFCGHFEGNEKYENECELKKEKKSMVFGTV